jgi:hypothetical protein
MLSTFNAILVEEANRLDGDLYERSIHTSPWIDLVDTGAFPEGIGDAVSTMIWERTLPTGTVQWQNLMGATVGNDSILPPVLTVSTAKTLREYRLQHTALESDNLNVNDLRTAVIRDEQLSAMRDNLSMNTNYLWRSRARSEYDRLATHITLVAAGNQESVQGGAADTTLTDTLLSNSALTRYRNRMIRMGAGRRPLDRIDGAPIFSLICDSEVSDAIKAETAITEALKFSGRANELLTPLGVEKAYKNFFHVIDDLAPRYTFTSTQTVQSVTVTTAGAGYSATPAVTFTGGGGSGAAGYAIMNNGAVSSIVITANGSGYTSAPTVVFTGGSPTTPAAGTAVVGGSYTEVLPYTAASADPANGKFGARLVENAAYETAAYTRSYIFHQDVMKLLYPNTVSGASGTTFDPVMYRGDWKWLNVQNLDSSSSAYNPDGTIGKFRGVFAAATKPGVIEYGFAITHKRPGF